MKKSFALFLFSPLFVSVFFISFISADFFGSWFDEASGKITGQVTGNAVASACIDSDNGKNYFAKGTASGIDAKTNVQTSQTDRCADTRTLIEYYCDANKKVASVFTVCSSGCGSGICKGTAPATTAPATSAAPTTTKSASAATTAAAGTGNATATIETSIGNLPSGCYTILNNGPTSSKVNIYFYDTGFNSNPEVFNSFVKNSYSFLFGDSYSTGVEPYKSLKQEFNVYSFRNNADLFNCGNSIVSSQCVYGYIKNKLSVSCPGFSAPTDFGESDGNYNIIVVPLNGGNIYSSGSSSSKDVSPGVVARSSSDLIYIQLSYFTPPTLAHEFGHRIGFFDEE
ncbi:hypothetical protein HY449_04000 [Candidatus Pacearchaeota archaeon]|nr:hypothetical protein [Candidatus Pacearchaeota archaeon]